MTDELTGQIIHGFPNLPVIDVIAVEEVDISLIELLVGLCGAMGHSPSVLDANEAGGRHSGHHRRGYAWYYDAQHAFLWEFSLRPKKISSSRIPSVCCVNPIGTEVNQPISSGSQSARWRNFRRVSLNASHFRTFLKNSNTNRDFKEILFYFSGFCKRYIYSNCCWNFNMCVIGKKCGQYSNLYKIVLFS